MDVGSHCAKSDCNQVDFLPFKCDCCASVFCLEHRSYDAHECPLAGSRDHRVVQCPLCKGMIRWTLEQDVNLVWEQHVHSGQCIPKSGATTTTTTVGKQGELTTQTTKKKKNRCGAERCREILLASNQFHCNKCGLDVCLRHRFEGDHECEKVRLARRHQRASVFSRPATNTAPSSASSTINTAKLEKNARAAASTIASGTRSAVNTLVQKGKAVAASTITTSSEQCPICQQKFSYVSQLIAHVNNAHPDVDTRSPPRAAPPAAPMAAPGQLGREVCPQCRAVFRDVASLISHVETTHSSTQSTAVGASGGSGNSDEKCSMM